MCNLSEVLIEQGIEKGIEKGIQLGELAGKVSARYEDGMSIEEIARKSNVAVAVVESILREKELL